MNFKYDPFGRRIQKSSASGTTNYLYDEVDLLEEVDTTGNTVLARYVQGPRIDEPLAMTRGGVASYYDADGLGSITSLTNSSGVIANTYSYDSFARLLATTGTVLNPFRYTAREFDSETGLYYYRARYYDTTVGRFFGEDPITFDGGVNFYTYVSNNPTNWFDPLGLVEGSPSNLLKRAAIDRIARGYNGSKAWAFDVRKDQFPPKTNKCNKFVCDVAAEAGAPIRFKPRRGAARCPRAGEIADNNPMKNWRALDSNEKPEPGDVAAYPLEGGGDSFSGHSGIITSQDNISAHFDKVGTTPGQFSIEQHPKVVYRRYTGD